MNLLSISLGRAFYGNPLMTAKILLQPYPLNVLISKYSTTFNGSRTKIPLDKLHRIITKSRVLSRLNQNPKFANYFNILSEAGATSTLISFFILHEFTAIGPLFGLWYILYQLDLPDQYQLPPYFANLLNQYYDNMEKLVGDNYARELDHSRLIVTGAISYSVVKLLYPIRILLSLWGAPYMGEWISIPFRRIRSKYVKSKKSKK